MVGQGRLLILNEECRGFACGDSATRYSRCPAKCQSLSTQLLQVRVRSLQGRDEEDVNDERGKDNVYRDFKGTSLGPSVAQTDDQFSSLRFGVVSSLLIPSES